MVENAIIFWLMVGSRGWLSTDFMNWRTHELS